MKIRRLLWALFIVVARTAGAGEPDVYPKESDHTFLLDIQSVPPGARITTVPAGSNQEVTVVGETPYVAVVESTWGTRVLIKQWKKLHVWSPGNMVRAEYDTEDRSYSLYARFVVESAGYLAQTVDTFVTTFPYPGPEWMDDLNVLPVRESLTVQLDRKTGQVAEAGAPAPAVRTVMVAAGGAEGEEDFGTLEIYADVSQAMVSADGQEALALPVRLLLRAGEHTIQVSAPGLTAFQRTLTVDAGQTRALRVRLMPDAVP